MIEGAPPIETILRRAQDIRLGTGITIWFLSDGTVQANLLYDVSTAHVGIDRDVIKALQMALAPPYGTTWEKHLRIFKGMEAI
jgi:hypothetical protein